MSRVRSVIREELELIVLGIISFVLMVILCVQALALVFGYWPDLTTFLLILALESAVISLMVKRYRRSRNERKDDLELITETKDKYLNFSLVHLFEKVLFLDYLDESFRINLEDCKKLLILFEQKKITVKSSLIKQIKRLLKHYYDLSTISLPTERSIELQNQIEEFFLRLKESLEKIYDRSLDEKLDHIELDLTVTTELLNQNLELR